MKHQLGLAVSHVTTRYDLRRPPQREHTLILSDFHITSPWLHWILKSLQTSSFVWISVDFPAAHHDHTLMDMMHIDPVSTQKRRQQEVRVSGKQSVLLIHMSIGIHCVLLLSAALRNVPVVELCRDQLPVSTPARSHHTVSISPPWCRHCHVLQQWRIETRGPAASAVR